MSVVAASQGFLGLNPVTAIGPIISLTIGTLAAAIAWRSLHTAAAVNLRNKRIDVISTCNQRYDALSQIKTAIITQIIKNGDDDPNSPFNKSLREEIKLYHRRYWGFKSDQLDYWLAGYVDPETLISWFMSTVDALHRPSDIWQDYSDRRGWDSVKAFHSTTNFRLYQVVQALIPSDVGRMTRDQQYAYLFFIFRSIELDDRSLINLLKRNSFRRLWMDRFKASLSSKVAVQSEPHAFKALRDKGVKARLVDEDPDFEAD